MSKESNVIIIMGLVTAALGKINPTVGAISSIYSTPGSIAVAMESVLTGDNNAPTSLGFEVNTAILGAAGTINSTVILWGLAATGTVVGGPVVLALTFGFTACALAGNKTIQDVLTDPDFYNAL